MSHRFIRFALLAALPLVTCSVLPQAQARPARSARASARRTVLDYLKLLPWEFSGLKRDEKPRLAVLDTANDYLETASGKDGEPGFKMAIFRHAGRALAALSSESEEGTSLSLLGYEDGRWFEMTRELVPEYSIHKLYELPRRGTTIRVFENRRASEDGFSDQRRHLYDLLWRNGTFTIRR